jgi:dihydroorotase
MIASTRRRFLAQSASLLALEATGFGGGAALAAMGPNDKFDLLIKGGDVLDPSQNLRGRRDIGIRWGVIEAVEPDIPAERALKVLNVAGKLVTPGLVDLHSHVYPYGSAIGIPADELLTFQGTTTRCRRATPAPTISPGSAATWWGRRARVSTPSCTSPIWA